VAHPGPRYPYRPQLDCHRDGTRFVLVLGNRSGTTGTTAQQPSTLPALERIAAIQRGVEEFYTALLAAVSAAHLARTDLPEGTRRILRSVHEDSPPEASNNEITIRIG
jgi:hypothetical protein